MIEDLKFKAPPPRDGTFKEICRYIMQVADPDYPGLPFIASLYTHSHYKNGLTDRQIRALDPHARLFLGYGVCVKEKDGA